MASYQPLNTAIAHSLEEDQQQAGNGMTPQRGEGRGGRYMYWELRLASLVDTAEVFLSIYSTYKYITVSLYGVHSVYIYGIREISVHTRFY